MAEDTYTREDMAAMLCVSVRQFDAKYRPLIPAHLIIRAGTGKTTLFAPQAISAITHELVIRARERASRGVYGSEIVD